MKNFGQIKTKTEQPRKFVVGEQRKAAPARLPITVMSPTEKLELNRKRVGSKRTSRGVQPFNAPAYSGPVSPR